MRHYYIFFFIVLFSCTKDEVVENTSSSTEVENLFSKIDPAKSNLVFENTVKENKQLHHFVWDAFYNGAGVSLGDINNDGLEDIFLTANYGPDKLFLNKGNLTFEDISATAGIINGAGVSSGSTMADVNNDGYLDIYVCKHSHLNDPNTRTNLLFINNKDNTFSEKGAFYGLANQGNSIQASFFDYDLDGDQDVFLMNQPSNNRFNRQKYAKEGDQPFINQYTSDRLFRNDNGKYVDVTSAAGLVNFAFGLGHNISDINNDGLPDIYVANDYDKPDLYYINNGDGTFDEVAKSSFNHISNFSMGMDVADINNDGLLDIGVLDMAGATHYRSKTNMPSMSPETFYANVDKGYHYQYMHNTLQLNQGKNQFSDIAFMAGVAKTDWSWSLLMADFDNDGYRDIHITNGIFKDIRNSDYLARLEQEIQRTGGKVRTETIFEMLVSTPMDNYLYHNDGNNHFTDVANTWGLADKGFSNGSAYADLDNDGDLDLVVNNVNANVSLFENKSVEVLGNNSIRIKPVSSKYFRNTVNTRVTIYYDNGKTQVAEVNPSRGYMSSSEAVAHFGIGKNTKIDSCIIRWPDQFLSKHLDLKVNTTHIIDLDKTRRYKQDKKATDKTLLVRSTSPFPHKHVENDYDPFETQLLLPYELSEMGPFISAGDINGDGLEDVYFGASAGSSGLLYVAKENGTYEKSVQAAFDLDAMKEDQRSIFFDADGDGDQDLYVCSGGYENVEKSLLEDRLYINDGKGTFKKSGSFPSLSGSNSTPINIDLEGDGDQDLVVFGRLVPGKYPQQPLSYVLLNENGQFTDKTDEICGQDLSIGMVTDACLIDYDMDGDMDIVAVGEWMAPTLLKNDGGKLDVSIIDEDLSGIYFSVHATDIDDDQDVDLILGNIGKNNKWKASKEKPFRLYADDFDKNGKYDIVLANYSQDKVVPVRGRQCSSEQLPSISDEFKTFDEFAKASIDDIYNLENAQNLEAKNFYSGLLRNSNSGFIFEKFDATAQMAPINGVVCMDINKDGKLDIISIGNLFSTEVETTRFDASMGNVLLNKGASFESIKPYKSGLYAKKDAKDVLLSSDKKHIIIANNNDDVDVFSLKE
jgi:hypothetical protein